MTTGVDLLISNVNEPPRYYGYERYKQCGYSKVTQCAHCSNVGLYEDCYPRRPCKHCGGDVREVGAGKWVPPVTRKHPWKFWLRPEVVSAGYWKVLVPREGLPS